MPIVSIKIVRGRPVEVKRELHSDRFGPGHGKQGTGS